MKNTLHLAILCVTAIACAALIYFSVAATNATILQAAHIVGDKLSPSHAPSQFDVSVDGALVIGNRKGSSFDVGMTVGKDDR